MRAVIVEDEPLASAVLREYLEDEPDVEVVGEAGDGWTAVESIEQHRPELVFLDVHLPELSGLGVLEKLDHRPAIVFTTAFDRYAVAAFEVEAVDYLVKPFGQQRFRETLERVRQRLSAGSSAALPPGLRDALVQRPVSHLYAQKGPKIRPIPVDLIELIEGAGDYSEVRCPEGSYLVRLRLKELERRLDGNRFLRVHRSRLVNLDRVAEIRKRDSRRLELVLESGLVAPASRSGTARLRQRMTL